MRSFPQFIQRLRSAAGLVAFMTATASGSAAENNAPAADTDSYFEQAVADSNPLRIAQAREYEAYIGALQQDPGQLRAVFQPDYRSPAAYVRSTDSYRAAFCRSIGYPCPGARPDEPARFEQIGEDGIGTYYRVMIAVLPGIHAEGIYIVPKTRSGPVPLVVAQHGGAGSPEQALFHGGANYHDMVRGAVKRGYAVFAPQLLFSSPGLTKTNRVETDRRLRLVGTTVTAVEVTKIVRSLDVLLGRPEIDPARVGMVGLSYGGFYTLVVTAIEPRIKMAVSAGYYGVQEGRYADDELSIPPDLAFPARMTRFRDSDLVALICPRPLQIQAGDHDEIHHWKSGQKLAPESAAYYAKLGLADRFDYRLFAGGHEFSDALAWPFVARFLERHSSD
ncbi:MAG TPA: dienelactone hydrolase family protein [Opitutus sp.]|nr:dienelactone hydrolase family protein [Opitutus sp.]